MIVRLLGLVAAIGIAVVVVGYFTLPIETPPGTLDALTLSDLTGASLNAALVVQVLVVATLALGSVLRPSMGPEVLAAGTLTLPWLLRQALSPFTRDSSEGALRTVAVAAAVVALALLVAMVLAALRTRPDPGGVPVTDAAVLVLAVGALWATLGVGWFRIGGAGAEALGGLLDTETWPSRGSWLGLLLSVVLLIVAVLQGGFARRVGGAVLLVLMSVEVLLRATASFETMFPPLVRAPFELAAERDGQPLPAVTVSWAGLLPPLVGAVAGVLLVGGQRLALRKPSASAAPDSR